MALHLQSVVLILLVVIQTKAEGASPNRKPSLLNVPLQPDFQDDQFQGKWYAVGVADNTIQNGNERNLTMYSINYELKANHSFNVNTTLLSQDGDSPVIPVRAGMTLSIYTAVKRGTLSYIMRVADTDYNQFAIVYVEKNVIFQWYFESTLYASVPLGYSPVILTTGRTKELSPELKERFINFTTSVGFAENNIVFTVPTSNDQLGHTEGGIRFSPDGAQSRKLDGESQFPAPVPGGVIMTNQGLVAPQRL
ncbi:neutrophil gelatinase-associated lipocalin-like [Cavia porcellus]|uniref:neutrophil gelatinase-associated lipocalin-like n=1 Tax=Cavia porcellus TaxID=10141 RepID=UPI002FDFAC24